MSGVFFQSLIDVDKWNSAKWTATLYLTVADDSAPPCMGIVFRNGEIGKEIFRALIERLGNEDKYEELRVAIIEGDIPKQKSGYSVHISSNPANTKKRAVSEGVELEFDQVMVVSRIHRMNPDPKSPHLDNFKQAYYRHGKYLLGSYASSEKRAP